VREVKLPKKNPKFKTVYLDLDETLIHCDENTNNYTVKLDFPVEGGTTVSVFLAICRQASECVLIARSLSRRLVRSQKSSFSQPVALHMLTSYSITWTHKKDTFRIDCTGNIALWNKASTPKI
jgi:hypothetical protein